MMYLGMHFTDIEDENEWVEKNNENEIIIDGYTPDVWHFLFAMSWEEIEDMYIASV